jgi:hypothetical protein
MLPFAFLSKSVSPTHHKDILDQDVIQLFGCIFVLALGNEE